MINNLIDTFKTWVQDITTVPYKDDARLVTRFTGMELTQEQFNSYKDQFTLRETLGSDDKIHQDYYGFGVSSWRSKHDVMNTVLNKLASAGIVYNLESKDSNPVFDNLKEGASLCLTQDQWPQVAHAYKSSEPLIAAVRQTREDMGLKPMDNVL